MKIKILALPLLALALAVLPAQANAAPEGDRKTAGPNGGRILPGTDPRAEFFVTPERKVQITFLDAHGKTVAPAGQVVTVTAGDRAAPAKLTFIRAGDVLLSDVALPTGFSVPTVVQIAPEPDAKVVTEKFNVSVSRCPECKYAEYACICEGH